jgi:hypothetical protein
VGTFLSGEDDGKDCKDRGSQESDGHVESTDCPKCSKPTRIVKRVKDRERGIPGGIYISCSACEFFENCKTVPGCRSHGSILRTPPHHSTAPAVLFFGETLEESKTD